MILRSALTKIFLATLNPLYVYEAKMSLLTRIAQTRQGADRLLDARAFGTLAQCDFLSSRPQHDHAFHGTVVFRIFDR
jgi:nuclear pore complex protein Nup205